MKKVFINNLKGILYSYSQVFFAKNFTFAIILLIVSFFDLWMGFTGFLSVLVSIFTANIMGYDTKKVYSGIYGFNPLLVGLGIGMYFSPAWQVLVFVVFAALMTLFISLVLEGVMAKYALPFLSLPFLFSIWIISMSFGLLSKFGLNPKDIYLANELYSIGGLKLVQANDWLNKLPYPTGLKIYFQSLGAIFFQFNVFAGIVIAVGLLIHSRQSFLMSLLGFYIAYSFYNFVGIDTDSFSVSYYGFNFILSAIALGSYFLIPTISSLIWTIIAIPILSIITIGTDQLLSRLYLSVYSLPFNIVVLGFIYALKLRVKFSAKLREVPYQQKNAEHNAYFFNNEKLIKDYTTLNFQLPVIGKWKINQAFDGEYTHKDAWKYAWDFIVVDKDGKEFSNKGDYVTDYYCYNKPVVAVAEGTVVDVVDGIEDNSIGELNLKQNWGNTVVINHGYGVYSQYSHLKPGSIKVTKGMIVKKGQILGNVGNSGRSPYPHLHFQFQISYLIGSKTLKMHFSNYIVSIENQEKFVSTGYPQLNQQVSNLEPNMNIMRMLKIVPGDVLDVELIKKAKVHKHSIDADIDIFNNIFLKNNKGEKLYFDNDNFIFRSLNYSGRRKTALHYLFLGLYFVPLTYYPNLEFCSQIPVNFSHIGFLHLVQDLFVNIKIFIKTQYKISVESIDDELNPSALNYNVVIDHKFFNKSISKQTVKLNLSLNENSTMEYVEGKQKILVRWKKR